MSSARGFQRIYLLLALIMLWPCLVHAQMSSRANRNLESLSLSASGVLSTNVSQFGGTAISTGTGAGGAGIPRVTVSNDSSLAANQSVNVAQINGVAPTMGVGVSGTGVQRVTIASDSTGQTSITQGGNTMFVSAAGAAHTNLAQIAAATTLTGNGNTGTGSLRVTDVDNDPCQTSGRAKSSVAVALSATGAAQIIAISGSTTIYVCGFTTTISGTTTPAFRFEYGTGTNCGTGNTVLTGAFGGGTNAASGQTVNSASGATQFATTASQALCVNPTGTAPSIQGVVTYVQQ